MSGVTVVVEDASKHPHCPHGPTILFSRTSDGGETRFYVCAACRDRKDCTFYLEESEAERVSEARTQRWKQDKQTYVKSINHRKLFIIYNQVLQLSQERRQYCRTCSVFVPPTQKTHEDHMLISGVSDSSLLHPSEFLEPLDNPKKEAQFLFSEVAVTTIVNILLDMELRNVICVGTPRIHEYIVNERPQMTSILLDFDKRYHSFFGPLQFCWYNMFNNYFFLEESRDVFKDFLKTDRGKGTVLIMDPPFGGRVELLAQTLRSINELYTTVNKSNKSLPIILAFPYFMEPQILNSLNEFNMLDYKVDYDNHPLFQDGPKGRKLGSPVRLFTNLDPCVIKLPANEGYKHCPLCNKWVSIENKHCSKCRSCTSKDGRTYSHCNYCERCVKPTWKHCNTCKRCALPDHNCQELPFNQVCFHCKLAGHKKKECPKVDHEKLHLKRSKGIKSKKKRIKLS